MPDINDLIRVIDENISNIQNDLSIALVGQEFNEKYETVWRVHEEAAIGVLPDTIKKYAKFLSDKNFDEKEPDPTDPENADFQNDETSTENGLVEIIETEETTKSKPKSKKAKKDAGKNRLADSEINLNGDLILLSIKSAQTGKTPANDLGTFNSYESKKKRYAAAYEVWISYGNKNTNKVITHVFFNRSYFFVGKHQTAGGVDYREKDGNMRPKSWAKFVANKPEWKYEDFEKAFNKSQTYRANRLVLKHLGYASELDRLILLLRLIKEFSMPDDSRQDFYKELKDLYIFSAPNKDRLKIYDSLMEKYEQMLDDPLKTEDPPKTLKDFIQSIEMKINGAKENS